jgi:kynurenine 3-monooxygenase
VRLSEAGPIIVVGAGPAGALLAIYLAEQGHQVKLCESRPDLRSVDISSGRSINLALATRGLATLQDIGVTDQVEKITIPMRGRMVHTNGEAALQPYGLNDWEVIHSVSRGDLNAILLDRAEATGRVELVFSQRCRSVDFEAKTLTFTDGDDGDREYEIPFGVVFGSDGVNSVVRRSMLEFSGGTFTEEPLDHGYKEISINPKAGGGFQIDPNALHIWPRGEFMLIALANPEGDFTVTLFMPLFGERDSFEALQTEENVLEFFDYHFAEFMPLVPDLTEQFFENPTGDLGTLRTAGWSHGAGGVLVGDAAYSIVPFHGQGMNLAMESTRALARQIESHPEDLAEAFVTYEEQRINNAAAIAEMALQNYSEMRSGVVDPKYLLKRELALELQRRYPDRVTPRYNMVMFTTMPYSEALARGVVLNDLLNELTDGCAVLSDVDFDSAHRRISEISPLPTGGASYE